MAKGKRKSIRVSERMIALEKGEIGWEELSDEEVSRGRLAAADGTFKGRPPSFVSRKFAEGMRAEQIRRWNIAVAETLTPSLKVLKDISEGKISGRVPADARMKSAIYLIERTVGKVPEKTEMQVEVKPWQDGIEKLVYDPEDKKDEAS
jgi:hypothetical protein